MRVAVWGAGQIGRALAYRLVGVEFVSHLLWINRDYRRIESRLVDLEHGLAFAPCCASVLGAQQSDADLSEIDLLILTQGASVGPNQTRADLLDINGSIVTESIANSLASFEGLVLVITNPVDALARLVLEHLGIDWSRVLGLGTVVETARLRAALAGHVVPPVPPRILWPYAIGTHDEQTLIVRTPLGPGMRDLDDEIWESIEREVISAPSRVKRDGRSTLHPVVEGIISVARTIASSGSDIHTVSVRDDETGLFFSVPTSLGRRGILARHLDNLDSYLPNCRAAARVLQKTESSTG